MISRWQSGWLIVAQFEVAGVPFGSDFPPVVVAEIGINHGGSIKVALQLAEAALASGIRFIKHQTHIPDAEMSIEAKSVVPGNSTESIYDIISRCTLSEEEELKLKEFVEDQGGVFFSTPFSKEAADRLDSWGVPLFKIGSGECNNYPLVRHIASKGKPVILSTGMNTIESISISTQILEDAALPYALLHTTNLYPTPHKLLRLGGISDLKSHFPNAVIGLSDHSTSNSACIASVALGARILERHFTDSRERKGEDIVCSMSSKEAKELNIAAHEVFLALGGNREPALEERVTMNFAFASVVATREIVIGELLSPDNIWVKRPSGGEFKPQDLEGLYGRVTASTIPRNSQINSSHLC
jgi:N-acetylneuraminate synthase